MSKYESPVYQSIFEMAQTNPTHPALIMPHGSLSFAQFTTLVRAFAVKLATHGVNRNSVVSIWDIGGLPFTLTTLAISLLGGRFVAASKFAILLGPRLGITHHIRNAEQVAADNSNRTILIDENWMKIPMHLPEWQEFPGPSSPDAPYMIAQSSGSTGAPKFIELSHRIISSRLDEPGYMNLFTFDRIGSLFNATSFVGHSTIIRTLTRGASFVTGQEPQFHLSSGTECFIGSPAQFRTFLDHVPQGTPKFKLAISVGAPITRAMIRWAKPHFDTITNVIGSTEVGFLSAINVTDEDMDIRCVGRPPAHTIVQIVDDRNQPLAPGHEGIIRITSPNTIKHYLIETDADKEIFQDGYFYPGDTGFLDQEGLLYTTGRVRDHFNINGTKINASRVDELISSLPGVKDVMAFMDADEHGFTILSAAILSNDDANRGDIIKAIQALPNTAIFKHDVPRRIYFVSTLPRNDNGKLMRSIAHTVIEGVEAIDLFTRRSNSH
jgi:cyanophycin synthetase